MSTDDAQRATPPPDEAPEPHLADPGNLSEAAQFVVTAAIGGVIGNAAYDLIKTLLQRHTRRRLMDKIREILPSKAAAAGEAPKQIEERVEQALQKAEDD